MKIKLKRKVIYGLGRPILWGATYNDWDDERNCKEGLTPLIKEQEQIWEIPDAKMMKEDSLPSEIKLIKDWRDIK